MAAFALSSLSIVGIPLTSGFVSKWYLVLGTVDRHSLILLSVLLVSSLLSAAYLGEIVYKAYFEFEKESPTHEEVREVPSAGYRGQFSEQKAFTVPVLESGNK